MDSNVGYRAGLSSASCVFDLPRPQHLQKTHCCWCLHQECPSGYKVQRGGQRQSWCTKSSCWYQGLLVRRGARYCVLMETILCNIQLLPVQRTLKAAGLRYMRIDGDIRGGRSPGGSHFRCKLAQSTLVVAAAVGLTSNARSSSNRLLQHRMQGIEHGQEDYHQDSMRPTC